MNNKIRKASKLYFGIIYTITGAFALICMIPFWLIITGSITEEKSILQNGYQFFPKQISFLAYQMIFSGDRILKSYLVTITVTVLGTLVSMVVTCMLSYSMAVKGVKYAKHISFFVFFTIFFSMQGGLLVPWYILTTKYLHLNNNILGLILPYAVNAWFALIIRNFFKGIPEALMESAKIDGANDIRILFQIVLPLSLPVLATFGLFYALQYWNDWWLSLMLIDKDNLFPLQFLLRALVSNLMNVATSLNPHMTYAGSPPAYSVRMATCVVTIGPIVFLYPFVQKYFIKGLTVGGVKG